jgi:NAD(P)-dependent dehydrogenase (short-subunit alcohol dehydrogenase family)
MTDPTVLVTGGTGGLGAAVTKAFLDDGWRVVVPWIAERELERVEAHDRLELVRADLFDPDAVASAVESAGPSLRAAVNLVGGFAEHGRVHETPIETFEEQLRLNLRPTYLVCAAVLPTLLHAGGGAIVCVSSRSALHPFAGAAGYCASKAAVLTFAQVVAREHAADRVRCNAVLPAMIDTPANRATMAPEDYGKLTPPEEIAAVIRFLCSDESAPTTGAAIPVYGGP